MSITEKGSLILKYLLKKEQPEKLIDISKNMNMSEKSLRFYLKEVTQIVEDCGGKILRQFPNGIQLEANYSSRRKMWSLLKEEAMFLMDSKTRRNYIIDTLLEDDTSYTIQNFSEDIGVSKNVITNDIEVAEQWFTRFDISVKRQSGIGIQISGTEMNLRQSAAFFNRTYDKPWIPSGDKSLDSKDLSPTENIEKKQFVRLQKAYPSIDVSELLRSIVTLENEYDFFWTPSSRAIILSQICTLIERYLDAKVARNLGFSSMMWEDHLQFNKVMDCSRYLLKKCSEKYSIAIPEEEINYIYSCIISAEQQYSMIIEEYENLGQCWKDISIEMVQMVSKVLKKDGLSTDKSLYKEVALYIKGMYYRIKNNIFVENVFLEDFKANYTSLFGACWSISPLLESHLGISINENEIVTIALMIEEALHKHENDYWLIRAVIVGWNGMRTGDYINQMIEKKIKGVKVTQVLTYSKALEGIPLSRADIILSIDGVIEDSRCVQISLPLTPKNIIDVTHKRQQILEESSEAKGTFVTPQLILTNIRSTSGDEILQDACTCLSSAGYVEDNYYEKVIAREKMSSTYIGKGIAIPHAFDGEKSILKEGTMVVRLDKPVSWGNNEEKVDIIFLLALRFSSQKNIKCFFGRLYLLLNDDETIQKIKEGKTTSQLVNLLSKGENNEPDNY